MKLILAILGFFLFFSPIAAADQVIWHIPHPDDETLGMAGGILQAQANGKDNIVVIYTGGSASGVRHVINGLWPSALHNRRLNPEKENYAPLTKEAFSQARLNETIAALQVLGVKEDNIYFLDYQDGALTVNQILAAMKEFHEKYPQGAHRTTAFSDPNLDHKNMARALYRLGQRRGVDIKSFRVYEYGLPQEKRGVGAQAIPIDLDTKRKALAEFSLWDPSQSRFAIGYLSVPDLFDNASSDPYEYMEEIPHWARLNEFALGLSTTRLHFNYNIYDSWHLRMGSAWDLSKFALGAQYSLPSFASAFYPYIGIKQELSSNESIFITGSTIVNRIFVEYRHKRNEAYWQVGLRI